MEEKIDGVLETFGRRMRNVFVLWTNIMDKPTRRINLDK